MLMMPNKRAKKNIASRKEERLVIWDPLIVKIVEQKLNTSSNGSTIKHDKNKMPREIVQ